MYDAGHIRPTQDYMQIISSVMKTKENKRRQHNTTQHNMTQHKRQSASAY